MTPKKRIKIGNLVKFDTAGILLHTRWHKFRGFVGLVIDHNRVENTDDELVKVLWCSAHFRKTNKERYGSAWWHKDYLEVIQ